jgi:cytoskeletal protein RodZ
MAGATRDARLSVGAAGMPGAASAALGDLLRGTRERRGLSLEQIARETKIPTRYLAALEHGDLAALPGGTYTRGEVIAFATAVGLDKRLALEHLDRSLHPVRLPAAAASEDDPPGRGASTNHSIASIAAIAAIAIAMTAWAAREFNARKQQQQPVVVEHAPSSSTGSPPAADIKPADRVQPAAALPRPSSPSSASVSSGTVSRTSQRDAALPQSASALAAAVAADSTRDGRAPAADDESSAAAPVPATARRLTIVTDPPGARVTVDGIGRGSTPVTINNVLPGTKQIRVTLSGYASVERTVQTPASGSARVVIPLHGQ